MFDEFGSVLPYELGDGDPLPAVLHEDLLAAYGTAFDTSRGGYLWDLCYVDSQALYDGWCSNYRLLAQAKPSTASWSLSEWEREHGLSGYGLSDPERRRRLTAHRARLGQKITFQGLVAELQAALGDTFVEVRTIAPENANVHVPDGTYPWGTVDVDAPWFSDVSRFTIVLRDAPGVSKGLFRERVGRMTSILNSRLNVWATFGWYKTTGFVLDVYPNLDTVAFGE